MPVILHTLIGGNVDRRTQTQELIPGTPAFGNDGSAWIYVGPATAAVAANATAATVTGTFSINATAGGSYKVTTAFAVGDYGWARKTTSPL